MTPRKIVVGAMHRSGSTWTFNAVRLLCEHVYGKGKVYASWVDAYAPEKMPDTEVHVIKAHDFDPKLLPATVITTVRDLRDAFVSAVQMPLYEVWQYERNGLTPTVMMGIEMLFIQPCFHWRKAADYTIAFERMTIRKSETVERLGIALFPGETFPVDDMAITLEILPETYDDFDPSQGYSISGHRRHVGIGGYNKHLPAYDIQTIETEFREWFDVFNYPREYADAVPQVHAEA